MISDTQTERHKRNVNRFVSLRRSQTELSSSFTSSTVAIKAYSESKVSGELDLPGVPCDGQTINWCERRCYILPVDLQEIR